MADRRLRHSILVAVSYNLPTKTTGIGIIVRATDKPKRSGPIVSEHAETHKDVAPTDTQEFGILRALELASLMGWRFVRVKSDSPLRKRLKDLYRHGDGRDADGLVGTILRLAYSFDEVQFRYVARRKNFEARKLARAGAGHISRRDTDDEPKWWEAGIDAEMVAAGLSDLPF